MSRYLFIPSLLLAVVLLYSPMSGTTEAPAASGIPESQNQIIKLTDTGVIPQQLRMKKEDSIAFFLNNTADRLATIEVDFNGQRTHCASANLKIDQDGMIRSTRPIGPRDFASTCFHDRGSYDFTVYGLAGSPSGIKGSIIVE